MFKKLRFWWRYEARYFHKDFVYGIKNLIRWFPVIWKDRDWDQNYIWRILKFKLTNQANLIKNNGIHLSAGRDAEKMETCVRLINKIEDDYYQMEYIDYHKSTFDFIPTENKEYHEMVSTELSENFDEYFKKYPLVYKRVMKGEGVFSRDSKKTIAMNIAHINHERAKKLLFKIMEQEIEHWWD